MNKNGLGNLGEDYACEVLEGLGYEVLDRNFRSRFGEIDIIARDGKMLCFVEVKLRSGVSHGLPREYVTARKQEKLRTTAEYYLSAHELDVPVRFDVAEVYADAEQSSAAARIEYIENAF